MPKADPPLAENPKQYLNSNFSRPPATAGSGRANPKHIFQSLFGTLRFSA